MKFGRKLLFAAPLVALLLLATVGQQVKAWDGDDGGCGWGGCYHQYWNGCGYGCGGGGYYAGIQDAQYDLQNNLAYQPYGNCLPCHSQDYWNNFHQGYDQYWNSHQEQNQGASVNINGDNNYVSINQYQEQNPLQQLAHTMCGWINCNRPAAVGPQEQGIGYERG